MAAHLLEHVQSGKRAVRLYRSSLEFVVTLLACLRTGIIAVPTNFPCKKKHVSRLTGILKDYEVWLTLTASEIIVFIGAM